MSAASPATALSAALLLPAAAYAQGAPTVGAAVTDAQGGAVGTITAVDGSTVTLRTDRHEVALPVTSFTVTEDAVLVGVTQAQLNAQVDAMLAQAQQQFVVGAVVHLTTALSGTCWPVSGDLMKIWSRTCGEF